MAGIGCREPAPENARSQGFGKEGPHRYRDARHRLNTRDTFRGGSSEFWSASFILLSGRGADGLGDDDLDDMVRRVGLALVLPVGFQNLATVVDLGFLRGPLIFVEEAAEDGPALDPHLGEVSDRVIGYGRAELAAAMRSPAVVVGLVLG
jgi:hypothetical protein